jgi:hypothetical protein
MIQKSACFWAVVVVAAALVVALGASAGTARAAAASVRDSPVGAGYRLLGGDGGVFAFSAPYAGSAASKNRCPANPSGRSMPNGSCWSIASAADAAGYWILDAFDGKIFTYGDAVSYGEPAHTAVYKGGSEFWPTAIQMVSTPSGKGYWVLEEGLSGLGTIQSFGDAGSYGDEKSIGRQPNGLPVAMAPTHDGKGYWIVDSDGGVFAFGDARFYGSMGGRQLASSIVGIAVTHDGGGYWLVGADGGVFAFGDASFGGSMANRTLNARIVGIAPDTNGPGYWLAGSDGGVFALGGAPFLGSVGGIRLNRPVFAILASQSTG